MDIPRNVLNPAIRPARYLLGLCLVALSLFVVPLTLSAQPEDMDAARDSEGTEFWICFQKNFRDVQYNNNLQSSQPERASTLTLKLFFASPQNAKVRVEIPGLRFNKDVRVPAGSVVSMDIDSAAQVRIDEGVERLGVHVTSDVPIAVYGLNRRFQTTDTYLALPVSVLGQEYMVMGYQQKAEDLLSQVAVVATEDETALTIIPSVETSGGNKAGDPYRIRLNKGDVYQMRPKYDRKSTCDLTGTFIRSDKPVAVFSGHNCAYIPNEVSFCNHLVEQLPPVNTWGRQFYVGNLANRSRSSFRVLASRDSTKVFRNFRPIAVLNAGEHYETHDLTGPTQITATNPVLVALFSQGSQNGDGLGDPMMILVSPTQQFMTSYRFATPVDGTWRHYVNVVVPDEAVGSVRLNGDLVNRNKFEPFGESGYQIARLQVPFGTHAIRADKPFGLYSYGLGFGDDKSDAYGNMGGQLFGALPDTKDTLAPLVDPTLGRDSLFAYVRENRTIDRGLRSIDTVYSHNMLVDLPKVIAGVPQIAVSARPQNYGEFGSALVRAVDVAGNVTMFSICYSLNDSSEYELTYSLGEDEGCSPPSTMFWGAYFSPAVDLHAPDFNATDGFTAQNPFDDKTGIGGIGGLLIGKPLGLDWTITGRLGLEMHGGAISSIDTSAPSQPDIIREGVRISSNALYLSSEITMERRLGPGVYALGGLRTAFALSKSADVERVIFIPADASYEETGTNTIPLRDGTLESLSSFRFGLLAGVGFAVPVYGDWTAFSEMRYVHYLSSVLSDADWTHSRIDLVIGFRLPF